jgi:hypothetical protein
MGKGIARWTLQPDARQSACRLAPIIKPRTRKGIERYGPSPRSAGEVVDLLPENVTTHEEHSTAIVKADHFETIRLVIPSGTEMRQHQVRRPSCCIASRAM